MEVKIEGKIEGMSVSIEDGFIHEESLSKLEQLLETKAKTVDSRRVYIGKELPGSDVVIIKRVSVLGKSYSAEDVRDITGMDVKPGTYHRVEIDIATHYFINGKLQDLMRAAGILHFPSPQEFFGEDYYRGIFRRINEMEKLYSSN